MPSNTSQAKAYTQSSASSPTQASKLSEDRRTPSLLSHVSNSTTESYKARKMSGDVPSYSMQRWLEEKPKEQPWSSSARLAGDVANAGAQDPKKVDGMSKKKE